MVIPTFEVEPLSRIERFRDFTFTQDEVDQWANNPDRPFNIELARERGLSDAEIGEYLGYSIEEMAYQSSPPKYEPRFGQSYLSNILELPPGTPKNLPSAVEGFPLLAPEQPKIEEVTDAIALGVGDFVVNKLTSGSLMLGQMPFTIAEIMSNMMGLNETQYGRLVAGVNQGLSEQIARIRARDVHQPSDHPFLPTAREVMGVILEAIPQAVGGYYTLGKLAFGASTRGLKKLAPNLMKEKPPLGPTLPKGAPGKLSFGATVAQKTPAGMAGASTSAGLGATQIYNETKQDALGYLYDLNHNLFDNPWLNDDQVEKIATTLAQEAFKQGLPVSAVLGIGLAPAYNPLVRKVRRALVTGITEGLAEGLEESLQGAIIDKTMQSLDQSRDPADLNRRLKEFILGGFAGNVFGITTGLVSKRAAPTPKIDEYIPDPTPEEMDVHDIPPDETPPAPLPPDPDETLPPDPDGTLPPDPDETPPSAPPTPDDAEIVLETTPSGRGERRFTIIQGFNQELDQVSQGIPEVVIPDDVQAKIKSLESDIGKLTRSIKKAKTEVEKEALGEKKKALQAEKAKIKPETRTSRIKKAKQKVLDKYDDLFSRHLPDEQRDPEGRLPILYSELSKQNKRERETAIDKAAEEGVGPEQTDLFPEDETTEEVVEGRGAETEEDEEVARKEPEQEKITQKLTPTPARADDRIQAYADIVDRFPGGQSYDRINNLFKRYSKAIPQNRGNILKKIEQEYAKLGLTPQEEPVKKKEPVKKADVKEDVETIDMASVPSPYNIQIRDLRSEIKKYPSGSTNFKDASKSLDAVAYEAANHPDENVSREGLKQLLKPDLVRLAKKLKVESSGSKDKLIDKIISATRKATTPEPTVTPPPKKEVIEDVEASEDKRKEAPVLDPKIKKKVEKKAEAVVTPEVKAEATPPPKKEVISDQAKKIFRKAGFDEDTTVDEPTADEPTATPEEQAIAALDPNAPAPDLVVYPTEKKSAGKKKVRSAIQTEDSPQKGKPHRKKVTLGKNTVGEQVLFFDNEQQADLFTRAVSKRPHESNEVREKMRDLVMSVERSKNAKTNKARSSAKKKAGQIGEALRRLREAEDATASLKILNRLPFRDFLDQKGNIVGADQQAAELLDLMTGEGGLILREVAGKIAALKEKLTRINNKIIDKKTSKQERDGLDKELDKFDTRLKILIDIQEAYVQHLQTKRGKPKEEIHNVDAVNAREVERIAKATLRSLAIANNYGVSELDQVYGEIEDSVAKLTEAISNNRIQRATLEELESRPSTKRLEKDIKRYKQAINLSSKEIENHHIRLGEIAKWLLTEQLNAMRKGTLPVDITPQKKALKIIDEFGAPEALANNKTVTELKKLAKSFKIRLIKGDSKLDIATRIFDYPTGKLSWEEYRVGRKTKFKKKSEEDSLVYKGENAFKFVVYRKALIEEAYIGFKKKIKSIEQNLKNKYADIEIPKIGKRPVTVGERRELQRRARRQAVKDIMKEKYDVSLSAARSGIEPEAIFAEIKIENLIDNIQLRKDLARVKTATMHTQKELVPKGSPEHVTRVSELGRHVGSRYNVDLDEMIDLKIQEGIESGVVTEGGQYTVGEGFAGVRNVTREQWMLAEREGLTLYQDAEGTVREGEKSKGIGQPFTKKMMEEGDLQSDPMRPDLISSFPEGTGEAAATRTKLFKEGSKGSGKLQIKGLRIKLSSKQINRGKFENQEEGSEGHISPDGSIRLNVSIGGKLKSESEVESVMRQSRIAMGALRGMPSKATLYAEHIQTGDMDTIKLYIGHVSEGVDFAYIELKDGEVVYRHIDMDVVRYYAMQTKTPEFQRSPVKGYGQPVDEITSIAVLPLKPQGKVTGKYAEGEPSYLKSTQDAINQAFTKAIGIVLHNRSTISGLNQIAKDRKALSETVGKEGVAELKKWEDKIMKVTGNTRVYVKQPIVTPEEENFWRQSQEGKSNDIMSNEDEYGLLTKEDIGCK